MPKEKPLRAVASENYLLNTNALVQLQNDDSSLTSLTLGVDLDIYDMSSTDGFLPHENDWGKLGKFIGRNTHLTSLKIATLRGNSNFDAQTREMSFDFGGGGSEAVEPRVKQWKDFCSGLARNTSVKSLTFHDPPMLREEFLAMRASGQGISGFDGVGMAYPLMSGWFENNTVESITMPVCYCEDANYDNSGELKKMATVLAKFSSLKSFSVEFDDQYGADSPCEVSAQIIDALSNHSNLESLTLSHSHAKWSRRGYAALARFLRSASKLTKLNLSGGGMSDEGAAIVCAALAGNETLKDITFENYECEITSAGWKGFTTLLSNSNGTIMDTYYSNHTLQELFSETTYCDEDDKKKILGDELFTLLKVNTLCNNKFDAARLKIILSHLTGIFSMDTYADMDLALLPHVLAYAGKTNDAVSSVYKHAEKDTGLMYRFVRGLAPVLFDASPSAAMAG